MDKVQPNRFVAALIFNALQYQPTVITPIQLGIVIERVSSYKLLGVIITNDLSWNEHCDSIHKKATKRLFVLRTLKRVGLGTIKQSRVSLL